MANRSFTSPVKDTITRKHGNSSAPKEETAVPGQLLKSHRAGNSKASEIMNMAGTAIRMARIINMPAKKVYINIVLMYLHRGKAKK